ncbi:hypothetical protein CHELA40_12585 [Chelatococcus asaccharovorans]|nr:hypothetical protein CHELA40_12585 [Chelatococcus asaccharovorans]
MRGREVDLAHPLGKQLGGMSTYLRQQERRSAHRSAPVATLPLLAHALFHIAYNSC